MSETKWLPGPWEYVPSDEHHGPYVCGPHGGDVCDCYVMSKPHEPSLRNGGTSKPILFFGELADANARLIAAAPTMADYIARKAAEGDKEAAWIMRQAGGE